MMVPENGYMDMQLGMITRKVFLIFLSVTFDRAVGTAFHNNDGGKSDLPTMVVRIMRIKMREVAMTMSRSRSSPGQSAASDPPPSDPLPSSVMFILLQKSWF